MARLPVEEPWLRSAVEIIVTDGASLRQAVDALGLDVTSDELARISKRPSYRKLLWEMRHKIYEEVGKDPNRSKDSVIGQLLVYAQKLGEENEFDKAAEVLFKVCKISGWVGNETNVNVFAGLTGDEFREIRAKLAAKVEGELATRPN